MKKIPKEFGKRGFKYTLLKREGNMALYEQYIEYPHYKDPVTQKPSFSDGVVRQYEVHKVRLNPAAETKYTNPDGSIREVSHEECEILAGDEKFGSNGWHFQHKKIALRFFNEMVKNGGDYGQIRTNSKFWSQIKR